MSTTYGDRPLRVTFTSSDSSGVAEFFDGSETGAIGITVPRFSTTERNNLTAGSVKQGMIIFNETDGKMQVYTGSDGSNTASSWTDIGGGTILADADGNTNIEIGATTSDEIDVDIAGTKIATFDAAGSIITAIDGVENKEFKNAFCCVRPPGHHSSQNKAAGFCILNNVSIGCHYLLNKYKYKKIAIVDFDVHHGNGTQDIFYDNENVLFISTHQYPFYPGTGSEKEKGKFNNICNIPLPAGTNSEEYLNAFEFALKRLKEFKPEFVLISAGFDSDFRDPLASFKLKTEDFYHITKRILETTKKFCNGKVISILEGGYDLQALQDDTKRHVDALIEFN